MRFTPLWLVMTATVPGTVRAQVSTAPSGPVIDTIVVITQNVFGADEARSNRFIELGPTRTRWESTCSYQFSSFMMKMMGFLLPGMFRKQNLKFLQNFKAFAEEGRDVRNKK